MGCAGATALSIGPAGFATTASVDFHVHPHYREQTPLAPILHKRNAEFDNFALEKEHDRIAAILVGWSESLRQPEYRTRAIENTLAAAFQGQSLRAVRTRGVRQSNTLLVQKVGFAESTVPTAAFVEQLREYLSGLSQIVTAEFQCTQIETAAGSLRTQVRYEIVGAGTSFYREQRAGNWQLQWRKEESGEYRLLQWQCGEETRSRSTRRFYDDITRNAFGGNPSYSAQLLHGVDYWRTVLDAASRIDIYGHNGVSAADIDGDGWDDIYICQPAGLPNRLYRNRGDGTFEDITETSGTGVLDNTACALFADVSNSGRQDLIVVRANGPLLFINEGGGRFSQRPDAFRFATDPRGTFTGAALADYDRDGWLDIYFCLYVYYQGTDQYKYPTPYYDANNGPPNFLLRNNRDGTFRDVTAESGLSQNNTRYSFCCAWTDSDNNGWPDLYVANDFGRKSLYRNNGDGTFTDVAAQTGSEDSGAGMSVCGLDYDNDGAEDLYVADMWTAAGVRLTSAESFRPDAPAAVRAMYRKHATGNSLFHNNGHGIFEDKTAAAHAGMGRWSWASDAWDFDHDGFVDLYVTNGMISGPIREDLNSFFWRQVVANSPEQAKPSLRYEQGWTAINELIRSDYTWSGFERNVLLANNRDGTFSDVSGALGMDFIEDGRSFALADFDGDGRLEVILKNRNAPQIRLLKNVMADLPPSISFRLRGTKSNRDAIGASITIETSAGRQTRRLQAGSGFLCQHSKEVLFGLGDAKGPIRASIRWPNGLLQTVGEVPAGHRIHVEEGESKFRSEPFHLSRQITAQPQQHEGETLPDDIATWLLSPIPAPDTALAALHPGKPFLLHLYTSESSKCLDQLLALKKTQLLVESIDCKPGAGSNDDFAAIYNLLYRSIFDRHRDLSLPTSLLIDAHGAIVKVYQGSFDPDRLAEDFRRIPNSAAERIAIALPFSAASSAFEFGRNNLSLGSIFFQRGYFDQAEAWFQLALRDDPASAEAQYGLGSVYLKVSNSTAARACFEQAVKLNAGYPDTKPNAWNNLGLLATQQGRTDEAIGLFAEALRINPEHLVSLHNLGNAYRQEKRWAEARRTLERALQLAPDDPEVNYALAMVFAQTDEPERAYSLLLEALRLRPNYPEAMNNLGVLYLRTHRRDQAVTEFEACIRMAPAFDQAYLNLARVYVIEGDREKARSTLKALLKEHPDHQQAQQALAEIK